MVEQEGDVLEVIREVQPCRLLLAYAHTVYQYEFADFRIKESFSVELTNCTVEPLTFGRFFASLEIGSFSRGLSAPVVFDVMKR